MTPSSIVDGPDGSHACTRLESMEFLTSASIASLLYIHGVSENRAGLKNL